MNIYQFLLGQRTNYSIEGLLLSIRLNDKCKEYSSGSSINNNTDASMVSSHYILGGQSNAIIYYLYLILVDRGILSLKTVVSEFLPIVPNADKITLLSLCNMSSGLMNYVKIPDFNYEINNNVFRQWDLLELFKIICDSSPLHEPHTSYYYSDVTNTLILVRCMEIKTNLTFRKLIKKYIIGPLQLNETYVISHNEHNEDNNVSNVLHVKNHSRIKSGEDSTYWNLSWANYASMIWSNISDLSHIISTLFRGELLNNKELLNVFVSPFDTDDDASDTKSTYAMGFKIDELEVKHKAYWANEEAGGHNGAWVYLPDYNLTICVQSTTFNGSYKPQEIIRNLINTTGVDRLMSMID